MIGNVMVGQSGGPTAVINSSLAGVFKTAVDSGCGTVYGMINGIEGLLSGKYTDISKHIKNDLDIELLKRTPSSFLGTCRYKLPHIDAAPELYGKIFSLLSSLDVKYFFYIGGNDSMDTVMQLSVYGGSIGSDIRFIGVPKTIDNDLPLTDHTPGYGSAAKYTATAMKEIIRDAKTYPHPSVTLVEIMGRDAGWLTAASLLSRAEDCTGPDLIYLPESVFDINDFLSRVSRGIGENRKLIIALSEGIKTSDGKYVCEANRKNTVSDAFGHKLLGGTALYLSDIVSEEFGIKSRGIVLSTLQRCASHLVSRTDITEAYTAGKDAVISALKGESGKMVIFKRLPFVHYSIVTDTIDIGLVANKEKKIPPEWITNGGTFVSEKFTDYASPLIIGELSPFMVNGLPRHLFIE